MNRFVNVVGAFIFASRVLSERSPLEISPLVCVSAVGLYVGSASFFSMGPLSCAHGPVRSKSAEWTQIGRTVNLRTGVKFPPKSIDLLGSSTAFEVIFRDNELWSIF